MDGFLNLFIWFRTWFDSQTWLQAIALFDEKLIVWSPVVFSRLIMLGIRAFIKMKHIESLLLPTNAFHPFYGSSVGEQKPKRSRFPFGFYNTTRILWSIRHVKNLTMLVARPDYRCWIIGALPFNSLSFNGKVFRSIVRPIKKCNSIPSKKFAN